MENKKTYIIEDINHKTWEDIDWCPMENNDWMGDAGIKACFKLLHDRENIYLRLLAREENIRAEVTEDFGNVWEDSCLEFFFAPKVSDARYLNFEWNPRGMLYLGFGAKKNLRVIQRVKNKQELFSPHPTVTDEGWGIEFKIPLEFIRLYFPDFSLEGEALGNFYKCGDKTPSPHYLSWSKIKTESPDFHKREFFGTLVFN